MFTLEEYDAIQKSAHSLAQVTASAQVWATLGGNSPKELRALIVSCNYLSTHFDAPILGRGFESDDCAPAHTQPIAVLNEALWRSQFDASPSIIGRTILLNKQKFTVIGVAKNQLAAKVPPPGIYVPFTMQPRLVLGDDFFRHPAEHAWLDLSGRLASGYEHRQVQAELSNIATQLDRSYPGRTTAILVTNGTLIQQPFFSGRAPLVVGLAMGSLSLILLIVCTNVAILLLARAASRQQEMAVRLSLGAGRGPLLRQLLTESMLVAALAGGVSLWLAPQLPHLILTSVAEAPPPEVSFQPDWRVWVYTFAIAILAGCVAGLSPALESLRFDLSKTLKPLGRGGAGPSTTRVRGVLVAAQLTISLALLTAAGLTFRAQSHLLHLDLAYDPNHVIQVAFPLTRFGCDANTARIFYTELIQRLDVIPGVRTVSIAQDVPFRGESTRMVDVSKSRDARDQKPAFFRQVSASYFAGLGVRLIRGRAFSPAEAARTLELTPVVVS